jgi:UDP-N-acetylglucosamine 2-epimerase (non-hydrolysing)
MLGTRPEIIRLSETIKKLDIFFEHRVIHSGQNSQLNLKDFFFSDLNLRQPDNSQLMQGTFAEQLGANFKFLENEVKTFNPDALVILGDTNTALAALLAKRMGVVTYHIEAGNRSFDVNVPEETNRKVIDHFADFNLTYSKNGYDNLMREGLHPRFVNICGSPLPEVINANMGKIKKSNILSTLDLVSNQFILASLHRQENVDSIERLKSAISALEKSSEYFGKHILISLHPRTKSKIQEYGILLSSQFIVIEPLGFIDYMKLQIEAFCTVSDSGSISEESSHLGFPAVTIRDAIERPEALETGSIILAGLEPSNLIQSISLVKNQLAAGPPDSYKVTNHSQIVVNYIQSTLPHANFWLGRR